MFGRASISRAVFLQRWGGGQLRATLYFPSLCAYNSQRAGGRGRDFNRFVRRVEDSAIICAFVSICARMQKAPPFGICQWSEVFFSQGMPTSRGWRGRWARLPPPPPASPAQHPSTPADSPPPTAQPSPTARPQQAYSYIYLEFINIKYIKYIYIYL